MQGVVRVMLQKKVNVFERLHGQSKEQHQNKEILDMIYLDLWPNMPKSMENSNVTTSYFRISSVG